MQISASMVKELRERTGAGMMECKKSLTEANGDMELAIEQMRITGLAKADKKAGNTAAEGMVVIQVTADKYSMVEINSQTDFAVKSDDFMGFANAVTEAVLNTQPASVDAISLGGKELEVVRKELVAKIGENIQVRRFVCGDTTGGTISEYSHGGGRIGVVCEIEGGDASLAKDVSMHIAASSPVCIDETGVPADLLEKEKAILVAEAAESGKPPEIVEKMVAGRIKKYLADITLVGQPFVKDPDQTVGDLLKAAGATIKMFHRLEVGEGIEKKVENFADEVMAQVRGTE
ncbi:MAG: translation elongation factor Ts [Granulosicoccaceae bacterium]